MNPKFNIGDSVTIKSSARLRVHGRTGTIQDIIFSLEGYMHYAYLILFEDNTKVWADEFQIRAQ